MNSNETRVADVFTREIEACTDLIRETWDLPVFTKGGRTIELNEVVATIFEFGNKSMEWHVRSMACSSIFREQKNARKEVIAQPDDAMYFYDGIYDALDHFSNGLDDLSKAKYSDRKSRTGPILTRILDDITGFDHCKPREYAKYLDLFAADQDVAYDFSMEKMRKEVKAFKGLSTDQLELENFPEINSLWNVLQETRYGRDIPKTFVGNILQHAELVKCYMNKQEIIAEVLAVDINAPFINEMVVLEGPWAKAAAQANRRPQAAPFPLQREQRQEPSVVAAPALSLEEQEALKEDKKRKAQALIASIYGPGR